MAVGDWPANPDGTWPVPQTPADVARFLGDPWARVCSGYLYKILVKNEADDSDEGKVEAFKPNRAQRRFMSRLWHRNLILKARQLGFTTLVAILWLDHALFIPNQHCVLIAQDLDKATAIFRTKIMFAYDRLPVEVRHAVPAGSASKTQLVLANGSWIDVTNSPRGGTPDRLHISEMGKIGAKFPHKAKEIVTGGFPSVPSSGIIVVESTAEGQDGEFYKLATKAQANEQLQRPLTNKDFRFHFYAWWQDPDYTAAAATRAETDEDRAYFAEVEGRIGGRFTQGQRNWYINTLEGDFSGVRETMWQEYPSYPEEAFMVSTEGTYYAKQLASARKQKRIGFFPHQPGLPVHSFWDIGNSDGTGIWLMQEIGAEHRFIKYIEEWGEPYSYFTGEMQKLGYTWGKHHLPHDAEHRRQQAEKVEAPIDQLRTLELGGEWIIVPRTDDVVHGINMTRAKFPNATFDEAGCAAGLKHLGAYRKEWDDAHNTWKLHPRHDEHSEAADAFRQYGQGFAARSLVKPPPRKHSRNWRTA